jgi:hypothetical protein
MNTSITTGNRTWQLEVTELNGLPFFREIHRTQWGNFQQAKFKITEGCVYIYICMELYGYIYIWYIYIYIHMDTNIYGYKYINPIIWI